MPGESVGCYFYRSSTPQLMTEHPHADSATEIPNCPRCQGPMWDNREGKRNPKAPDFKCKDRECDGVIWPPRNGTATAAPAAAATGAGTRSAATAGASAASAVAPQPTADGMPPCPVCGGAMW